MQKLLILSARHHLVFQDGQGIPITKQTSTAPISCYCYRKGKKERVTFVPFAYRAVVGGVARGLSFLSFASIGALLTVLVASLPHFFSPSTTYLSHNKATNRTILYSAILLLCRSTNFFWRKPRKRIR